MTTTHMTIRKNNEGVSAVIGVILMVAITVILAAIIAVFAFNLGTTLPKNKNLVLEVNRLNSSCIYVKVVSGNDMRNVIFDPPGTPNGNFGENATGFFGAINVSVNGIEVPNFVAKGTANCTSGIGSIQYFSPVPANVDVIVIGNFKDGTQQVAWTGTL